MLRESHHDAHSLGKVRAQVNYYTPGQTNWQKNASQTRGGAIKTNAASKHGMPKSQVNTRDATRKMCSLTAHMTTSPRKYNQPGNGADARQTHEWPKEKGVLICQKIHPVRLGARGLGLYYLSNLPQN